MQLEGNPNPYKMHANPDFHDGQVLIDEESKTVTINNKEREYAADLLTMVGGGYSSAKTTQILKENSGVDLDPETLDSVLKSGEHMDVFVKLLGNMTGEGSKVPGRRRTQSRSRYKTTFATP